MSTDRPGEAACRVIRHGPVITPEMLPLNQGRDLSGPSLIAVPTWLPQWTGRYHLYFASHRTGGLIRRAHADQITGPWQVGAAVRLTSEGRPFPGGVNGPEVLVDDEQRRIRMYFNGHDATTGRYSTLAATSIDGLDFEVVTGRLGPAYCRVLRLDDDDYLFVGASGQRVLRSADGFSSSERGPMVLPGRGAESGPYSRHVAVQRAGEVLRVFYSRKGDAPERILVGEIDLTADWRQWRVRGAREVLRPEMPWEGADLPLRPSRNGPADMAGENALRDPAIFESDGRTWLLYAYAGERGIALAELLF